MAQVIGLCGGSGSGKGLVGSFFSKNGYLVIDTDKVYREITDNASHCLDTLVCEFGAEILTSAGTLNRKKLAEIVFSDQKKLKALNEITHRHILERVRFIIDSAKNDGYLGFVVDAPLLYESGFDRECDFVIAVISEVDKRIDRIIKRDNITREAAIKRINSQASDEKISKLADFVIVNNGDIQSIERQVNDIIKKII